MLQSINLKTTMQHFSSLTAEERELFLAVASPPSIAPIETQRKAQKRKKQQLPIQFSEEALYQSLVSSHPEKVRKLKLRMKNKVNNHWVIASNNTTRIG